MNSCIRILAQVIVVSAISSMLSLLANSLSYRSGLNALWIFLFPAVVAIYFNDKKTIQISMAVILMAVSFVIAGMSAVIFGFY